MTSILSNNKETSILNERSITKLALRKKKLKDDMQYNNKLRLLHDSEKGDSIIKRINTNSFPQINHLNDEYKKKRDIGEQLSFCNVLLENRDSESNLYGVAKLFEIVEHLIEIDDSKINIYITSTMIEKLFLLMISYKNDLSITVRNLIYQLLCYYYIINT